MCYRWISTTFGTLPLSDSVSCQGGTRIGVPTPGSWVTYVPRSAAQPSTDGSNPTSSHRLRSCQYALWLWIDSSDEAAVVLSHPDSPFSGGHEGGAVPDQNG